MSLYHEAASILEATSKNNGSIKHQVYGKTTWRSDAKTLFALSTEAVKWSEVLTEVVEKSGILKTEKQLSPSLALVLTHDLLLSKKGVALPSKHGLNTTITRHKARLAAELTKARLRRGFATVEALRDNVASCHANKHQDSELPALPDRHPRWVRVNTLRTTLERELGTTFSGFTQVKSLAEVLAAVINDKPLFIDQHIPNLVALPALVDFTASKAYLEGNLIFQDKASCFPAVLLDPSACAGDIIDACAAPGNKTTHLAAMLQESRVIASKASNKIVACERDPTRSLTLQKMVKVAGAEGLVMIKAKQDFLRLDPNAAQFKDVTALLLDPSCSGSGIVGRDEGGVTVHLPSRAANNLHRSKKRKRNDGDKTAPESLEKDTTTSVEEAEPIINENAELQTRLAALSSFQQRLLEHAMAFPAARRITYSTCSIHAEENEEVVVKALQSSVAQHRGWQILERDAQVDGLRRWECRGLEEACKSALTGSSDLSASAKTIAEACIRCEKGTVDGTMGFFVVAFVRLDGAGATTNALEGAKRTTDFDAARNEEKVYEEWEGFSDEGT